ncbi:Isoleucine--tRNA ligase [Thalassoglobus neptunius]|uniref:Isoleucine--tRNA ligase n=1 Tax=Thalassoglobus neptunius TaxID=1938619 RepID=A0A5C5X7V6_9PLAN|nr:class I tRNA ligase family protein [Thalassoglobus neptunius]TWT59136.1 Isoleucine--tRNA ligase [Thalassoglobus neptunius]
MLQKVDQAQFLAGEHEMLRFWRDQNVFRLLQEKNRGKKPWSFLDGPITANNPMGVHHAWGRTYKDAYQRYFAMTGHELRYQNGFDCQGLWVEVEVEKQLNLGTKSAIAEYGIDKFVHECKRRVLNFAARQTEQSIRLGYWMEWDNPDELRKLADKIDTDETVELSTPKGVVEKGPAEQLVARLGNPEWGGSYFTFATENNETIWKFLKKCFERKKVYLGHDVMPWGGKSGSAYSQMEVADGRKLTTHKSVFVRFPLVDKNNSAPGESPGANDEQLDEFLLIWTTTPWTLTSNVATMINPDLDYIRLKAQIRGDQEPAIYYFAKDNLNYKRLEREFKEGFGRPEWQWPEGLQKLKTIAQIFKEQGGFEEIGTIKGAEMVGWRYQGPFDELDAQKLPGGFPSQPSTGEASDKPSSVDSHRVIDGGRDFKGNAIVVAGEGTGIVHSAPGCGDVDHKIGMEVGLPAIAPLREDGTFSDGFGLFTGKKAVDPATAEMVFDSLKEKGLLVYVETYPHVYPHCWRTGEELVFRLVDEWFINMDWRDEIKAVTEQINWIPESIQGKDRELEWLSTMRDWMISKKRFWGLALPIWVNPKDPTDFEVIGSLEELERRARDGGEGWDEFEGHTPHRPWIDKIKLRSQKTGALLERVEDVGNPWLDAGIVPFSTMMYNHDQTEWQKWFPADLVTECFPGQFRNWFYSLLSLATMMRYDETEDPKEKMPFRNLLGHRLVMDEHGNPMHKSDGTAIWFEEAAEQLGVDTLRWMYLAQNPASDLRFGLRIPQEPVTLETVDGPISETKEGLPTCKVTSTPADNVRRQVLIPLWNSYAFFVNYAVLDGFDPKQDPVPLQERPEIDRWVLSRLQELTQIAHDSFQAFDVARFMSSATEFIDELSNWYIRRNRRRFWKAVEQGQDGESSGAPEWDTDKLAAYQTLYEVLVTLSKLLAPAIPFLSERIYQNLVSTDDGTNPVSVHLCDYPEVDSAKLDPELSARVQAIQTLVRMGHRLRETAELRVRQPLAELRFACQDQAVAEALEHSLDIIGDELNVKSVQRVGNLDDLVNYIFKPNLKTLGPKYGKLLGAIRKQLPEMEGSELAPLRSGQSVTLSINGEEVVLGPDDVLVSVEQATDWASADSEGIQIALSTKLTEELIHEGMARDLIRHIQQLRKDADLEEDDRIRVSWSSPDNSTLINQVLTTWMATILTETRASEINESAEEGKPVSAGDASVVLSITSIAD